MKLYARLETKCMYNNSITEKVTKYYTAEQVFNEYWSDWVGRVPPHITTTKDNCLTDWLKTYSGWIEESEDDPDHDSHDDVTYNEIRSTALNTNSTEKELKDNDSVNCSIKEITLRELYDNLAASIFDIAYDGVIEPGDNYYFEVLSFIAYGNIQGIRGAFTDGNSFILVPDIQEGIEEVRIYDKDKLLMVVVGDEIQY